MNRDAEKITPSAMMLAWRLLGTSLLAALWLGGQAGPEGLVLVLFLATAGIARWRFRRFPDWTVLLDQAACGAAMVLWPHSVFGLALPVFDAVVAGAPWLALPTLVLATAMGAWSVPLAAALLCAALSGWSVRLWARQLEAARRDADRDRPADHSGGGFGNGRQVLPDQAAQELRARTGIENQRVALNLGPGHRLQVGFERFFAHL